MSRIAELGVNFTGLPAMLVRYEQDLKDAASQLEIKGKKLEMANSENSAWLHYYDQRKVELHTIVKFFQCEVERVRSNSFKSYKEGYSRALGEREINRYIDGEPEYLKVYGLLLEVEEMYEQYQSVVGAFTTRNYALNNITKIRVAQLEYVEI